MNPLTRTFAYVAVAGVTVVAASSAWYASKPSAMSGYGDVGQEFFVDFKDPAKAAALSVVEYDEVAKEVQSFSVKQGNDGLWVIPSHHNYPAEAADRLAKTATSLLGVSKVAVQSRTKEDWKSYVVVPPEAEGAATGKERGTRITLRDGSGNALVDLIVGKAVEGRDGHYFVREPDKDTTYIAKLNVDLSAKFSDWIEPDLLKINESDIVSITVDNYSVDEQRGAVDKKELLTFLKKELKTSGDWVMEGMSDDTEKLDPSPIREISRNLDQLKIVGVRPKPEGLDDNIRVNPLVKQVLQQQMQSLGYFIGGDSEGNERLYANEGELVAGINNGVEYTLYFGEIARGTGKEIEVGLGDAEKATAPAAADAERKDDKEAADDKKEEGGPRRYLLVKVGFKEQLLGSRPKPPTAPVKPEILNGSEPEPKADGDAAKAEAANPDAPKPEAAKPEADDSGKPAEPPAAEEKPAPEPEASKPESESASKPDADPSSECAPDEKAADEPAEDPKAATEAPAADAQKDASEKPSDEKPAAEEKPAAPAADEKPAAAEAKPADAPEAKPAPEAPKADPKKVAQQEYDTAMGNYEAEKKAYETDLKAFEEKIKTGKSKSDELTRRFAGWYYVISADSFDKFHIERKDVVSKKEAKDPADTKTDETPADSPK